MAGEDAIQVDDAGTNFTVHARAGQPCWLTGPSARLNPHFCLNCDDMVQRVGYAKYRRWPQNLVLFPQEMQGYFQRWTDERELPIYAHARTLQALVESAETHPRCHLCALMLDRLVAGGTDPRSVGAASGLLMNLYHHKYPGSTLALYDLRFGYARRSDGEIEDAVLQLSPMSGQRVAGMPLRFSFPRSKVTACPLDDDARRATREQLWMCAKRWLQDCLETHGPCRAISERAAQFFRPPARLIDVGNACDYSDVRLRSWASLAADRPRWVALSHCWGPDGIQYKLQRATLETFHEAMCFERLSQNFKDAIEGTRVLASTFGKLYLWIDALCIIQDSGDDWATESVKMGHIYSNSLCTFMACRGSDSAAGLLEERNDFSLRPGRPRRRP